MASGGGCDETRSQQFALARLQNGTVGYPSRTRPVNAPQGGKMFQILHAGLCSGGPAPSGDTHGGNKSGQDFTQTFEMLGKNRRYFFGTMTPSLLDQTEAPDCGRTSRQQTRRDASFSHTILFFIRHSSHVGEISSQTAAEPISAQRKTADECSKSRARSPHFTCLR